MAGHWVSWPDTGQHRSSAKNINFAMETKVKKIKLSFIILRTKQIFSGPNFRILVPKIIKLLQC